MKRTWFLGAAVMVAGAASSAHAQNISVSVNGSRVDFGSAGPQQVDGRVLVPLRGVLEKLGATVNYRAVGRVVSATRGSDQIELSLGQREALINGRSVLLDVPAQELLGRTYVPLRFVGEALGAAVRWNSAERAVTIETGNVNEFTPPTVIGPPTGQVSVVNFSTTATGFLKPGSSLTLNLEGSPGGTAVYQLPGLTQEVPMREVSPGRYQATFLVPTDNVAVLNALPVARLRVGSSERIIQAATAVSVDSRPPLIEESTPQANARIAVRQPNITAVLDDPAGSGVDVGSVQVFLNGADVTRDAIVNTSFVAYRPARPLNPGTHQVAMSLRDKAGNRVERKWAFEIVAASDVIQSFVHDGTGDLEPGEVVTFTMLGEPGGSASFSVGEVARNLSMSEVSPGKYVGEYIVRRGQQPINTPVIARLRTKGGDTFSLTSPTNLGANATPPAPELLEPKENATVGNQLVVQGTAAPNSRVKIRVDFRSSSLLGVLGLGGSLGEQTVTADAQGRFKSDPFPTNSLSIGKGTVFNVTATALNPTGKESMPTRMQVVRG